MKQVWAPWRMDYILEHSDADCFICDIFAQSVEQDKKNLIIYRGETCGIVMNRFPYSNGHLLVAPYRHIPDLKPLNDQERAEIMTLTTLSTTLLSKIMNPDGFNVGMNLGEVAGAGLKDHVHMHIVPRWNGDTNFMPVLGDTKIIPQALEKVWELLQKEI